MNSQIKIGILFLFLCTHLKGQDLSGKWRGVLFQDDKNYNYKMETSITQTGKRLSGVSAYTDINGYWVTEEFIGSIEGDNVTLTETKVLKFTTNGFGWCVKKLIGKLRIDKLRNEYIIEGTWQSYKVFDGTDYYSGSCAPGEFRITKAMNIDAIIIGQVVDKQMLKPIKTKVFITGTNSGRQAVETSIDGTYSFKMPLNEFCFINILDKNYDSYQESFVIDKVSFVKNIFLIPTIKEATILKNVLFEQSSDILLKVSFLELDKLVQMMLTKKMIHIQLNGHTDKVGDSKLNQNLSERRVMAVKRYLVDKGIMEDRISTEGYGDRKNICTPPCEENRRVEFVITKQ